MGSKNKRHTHQVRQRNNITNEKITHKQNADPETASKKRKKTDKKKSSKPLVVVILATAVCVILGTLWLVYNMHLKGRVNTPLGEPKMNHENSTSASVDPKRFWGTYRSNLYFGLKTRSPTTPVVGLMWMPQFTNQMPPPIRHWCSQEDKLPQYGWVKHDGVNFGIQEIVETHFNLTTKFVKRPGGNHGGDWSARLTLTPKDVTRPSVVSLFFYIALDGQGRLQPNLRKKRMASVDGYSAELGNFKLSFPKAKNVAGAKFSHLISYASRLDRLKELVQNSMRVDAWDKERTAPYLTLGGRLIPKDSPEPNFMVHQVTVQIPFEMDVVFESESFHDRTNALQDEVLTAELQKYSDQFDSKFSNVLELESKGYNAAEIDFAKAALSNMVGGIGYFYGSSLVKSKYNEKPVEYWPAALYTAVPSRSFFPRGFLWDEGFHNLLISQWDPEISKDIISHWLDLINAEGWIPREQILGLEARAKVPEEFVVQHNENANPPTLFLPLQRLIKEMKGSHNPKDKQFLKSVFPRLKVWYNWFNTTQVGSEPLTYRWRGRDEKTNKELNPKTLTSGLDDFPRASHPNSKERHVDLRCWMALASGILADIATELGENGKEYEATYEVLTNNELLDKLHWSPKRKCYADYGLDTYKIKLVKPKPPPNLQPGQPWNQDKIRDVRQEPTLQFVDSFGYVSLFPFMLKIVDPHSPKLFQILSDLKNQDLLWTNYGLRSLARNAPLYNRFNTEHDPPYWRGAIWININYLTLSALHHYSNTPGPYHQSAQEIYKELRTNIVNNIIKEYYRTGFVFEQYSDKTGEGKGCHPFTGWSALVVMIMAEKY